MIMRPSSPTEIRSQVGDRGDTLDDSDSEKHDSAIASQFQFATQVPLRQSPQTATGQIPLAQQDVDNVSDASLSHSKSGAVKSSERHREPVDSRLANFPNSSNDDSTSTPPELTQQQILPPPSSTPRATCRPDELGENQHPPATPNSIPPSSIARSTQDQPAPMPSAVLQIFRALRQDCREGRHIPRYLQIIPKDQAKLLDSDDQWQPPLVGRPAHPGTVPIELLNYLTRKADLQASTEIEEAQRFSQDRSAALQLKHYVIEHAENKSPSPDQSSGTDASQEVSWSSSPARAPKSHPGLPPDSSPLVSDRTGKCPGNISQIRRNTSQTHTEVATEFATAGGPAQDLFNEDLQVDGGTIDTRDNDNVCKMRTSQLAEPLAPPKPTLLLSSQPTSSLPKQLTEPHKSLSREVQVKRTPFTVKEKVTYHRTPDSSTNIIPGTFDKRAMESLTNKKFNGVGHCLTNQVDQSFEDDSSEDQVTARNDYNSEKHKRNTPPSATASLPTPLLIEEHNETPKMREASSNSVLKRKRFDPHLIPTKRTRTVQRESMQDQMPGDDYQVIDDDRLAHRRQIMSKIARKEEKREPIRPSDIPSKVALEQVSSPTSKAKSWSSSPPRPIGNGNTSDTHQSMHLAGGMILDSFPAGKSISDPLRSANFRSQELLDRFQSAYSDYKGQHKHFSAACQLLRRLYMQGKATHPSLWDDFVFHHYHNYRTHLQEVMENCGSALPYEQFYDECIEEPSHLHRVLKPSYISRLHTSPRSSVRYSLLSMPSVGELGYQGKLKSHTDTTFHDPRVDGSSVGDLVTPNRKNIATTEAAHDDEQPLQAAGQLDSMKNTGAEQIHDSQNSRNSVKLWLEKAAGAESPILGGSVTEDHNNRDLPMIDLTQQEMYITPPPPKSPEQRKRKSLPWKKKSLISPDKDISGSADAQPLTQEDSHPKSTQQSNTPASQTSKLPTVSPPIQPVTQPPPKSIPQPTKADKSRAPIEETAYQRFNRLYGDLHSEKTALTSSYAKAPRQIDIFAWRD